MPNFSHLTPCTLQNTGLAGALALLKEKGNVGSDNITWAGRNNDKSKNALQVRYVEGWVLSTMFYFVLAQYPQSNLPWLSAKCARPVLVLSCSKLCIQKWF